MAVNRKETKWPEHISWWDKNEKRVNIVLWVIFFALLAVAYILFSQSIFTIESAMLWGALFILDLTLLSFISNGVNHHRG